MAGHIIVAGGTGFMGHALIPELLQRFDRVIVLTRGQNNVNGRVEFVHWDGKSSGDWEKHIDHAWAVVNLVGRTVDCVKTDAHKREILESRVHSVHALARACRNAAQAPKVWVQSATAHIFGDTDDEILDESSPIGTGFAPQVGTAWEAALNQSDLPNMRVVILRISFVLGRNGGALGTLARLARWGLGGTTGTGRQYMSWIHMADLNRVFMRAIEDESMQGMYVVTAPNPATNRDFMRELRRAVHRPWSPPVPEICVRIGSFLMRTDPELALLGRRCVPTRLLREGFEFRFPDLGPALRELLD